MWSLIATAIFACCVAVVTSRQSKGPIERKRQSNGIYAQGFFGAEVESWWYREGSNAGTEAGRRRIS
jgi:hypothetical protein